MNISLSSLQKLAALNLSPEQMAGVVEVLTAELNPPRSNGAERQARYRKRLALSSSDWEILRVEVRRRDDFTCQYCGGYGDTVDHVIPLAAGGPSTLENLVAACDKCNSAKRDRPVTEWEVPQWRP